MSVSDLIFPNVFKLNCALPRGNVYFKIMIPWQMEIFLEILIKWRACWLGNIHSHSVEQKTGGNKLKITLERISGGKRASPKTKMKPPSRNQCHIFTFISAGAARTGSQSQSQRQSRGYAQTTGLGGGSFGLRLDPSRLLAWTANEGRPESGSPSPQLCH